MSAQVLDPQAIPGVKLVALKVFEDPRGRFIETFRQAWFPDCPPMIQGNRSDSAANVLRGLHFHRKQADYWYVPRGRIVAGLADLRVGSPTEGAVATVVLGEGEPERALYIPSGVAHGYYTLTEATLTYLVDQYYDNSDEFGVAWDDPALGLDWKLLDGRPLLSERDQQNPLASELDSSQAVLFS